MKTRLLDITEVIRSKNAGPYELTFDIMFKDYESFRRVCAAGVVNNALVCRLYGIDEADIINIIEFTPAKAIKITIKRPSVRATLARRMCTARSSTHRCWGWSLTCPMRMQGDTGTVLGRTRQMQ